MPGWHKATQELREKDELVVLGVVQEQHAERAQLYAQWRQFDWPILQDQMNSIGIAVVPVAVLIDEFGIVQKTRFRANKIKELVAENREAPESPAPKITDEYSAASSENSVSGYIRSGDEKMKTRAFSAAITSYEQALSKSKSSDDKSIKRLIPAINFRLGVAYRAQFDGTESNDPDDFATASKHWTAALNGNPNQYIWRRRIEQYGPRNIKPYPFYDWVEQAIAEIKARGEDPIELQVALSGAEIAQPSKQKLAKSDVKLKNPDPDAAITKVDLQSPMIK